MQAITFHEALMPFLFFVLTAKPAACKPQKNLLAMFVLHVIKNQFRSFCDFDYKTINKTIVLQHCFNIFEYSWWSKILARKLFKLQNGEGWDFVKVKQNHSQVVLICRFVPDGSGKKVVVATRGSKQDIYSDFDWEVDPKIFVKPPVKRPLMHDDAFSSAIAPEGPPPERPPPECPLNLEPDTYPLHFATNDSDLCFETPTKRARIQNEEDAGVCFECGEVEDFAVSHDCNMEDFSTLLMSP